MILRIEDSIKFQNHIQIKRNEASNRPLHYGLMNKSLLARAIWPKSKEGVAMPQMTKLIKGGFVHIKAEWILIIADRCFVDANFVLNQKSKFDNKFENIGKNKSKISNREEEG